MQNTTQTQFICSQVLTLARPRLTGEQQQLLQARLREWVRGKKFFSQVLEKWERRIALLVNLELLVGARLK